MQVVNKKNIVQSKSETFIPAVTAIQRKLSIGAADDIYEQEADAVADRVVSMSEPKMNLKPPSGALLQKKCAACKGEEQLQMKPLLDRITPLVQRRGHVSQSEGVASDAVTTQISRTKGGGSKMDHTTQDYMESRFGTDFSEVNIHTNSNAIQLSRELNAQAFTVGNDIYFNQGKYNPTSNSGKHLLAHELTHTVQQGQKKIRRSIISPAFNPALQTEEENTGNNADGQIQLMRERNQSGGRDHVRGGVAPWRRQGLLIPSGDDHRAYTDNGTSVNVWTAINYGAKAQRYWCHGHTLGTYKKWFYSVYSRDPLRTVIANEYSGLAPQSVRKGDIAVWTPSYDHSCKIEKPIHTSSGALDENATQVSTKNGLNPLRTRSLSHTKGVYASLKGAVSFFRKK